MKEKIKNIKFVYNAYKFIKNRFDSIDFCRDRKFFLKHFIYGKKTTRKNEYDIMLAIHQLEKGMTSTHLRPFGVSKVHHIINLLELDINIMNDSMYVYNYALSILNQYVFLYEENGWTDHKEYILTKKFIEGKKYNLIDSGAFDLFWRDIKNDSSINYDKFLSSRHSIRNFANRELAREDIEKAVNMAIKSPSACNRQMCKIYYIKKSNHRDIVMKKAQGLSLFETDHINFFMITFDVSANSFIGERNQGWFNAGLFAMNFVNGLHSLGIGSCFIQFGNSFKEEQCLKKSLNIPECERIAVIIAAGYYDEVSRIPYSTRKDIRDVYFER